MKNEVPKLDCYSKEYRLFPPILLALFEISGWIIFFKHPPVLQDQLCLLGSQIYEVQGFWCQKEVKGGLKSFQSSHSSWEGCFEPVGWIWGTKWAQEDKYCRNHNKKVSKFLSTHWNAIGKPWREEQRPRHSLLSGRVLSWGIQIFIGNTSCVSKANRTCLKLNNSLQIKY